MSYNEAIDYLYNARPPFHVVGADAYKPGLENTLRLMAHVGNPQEHLRAVHVAGTNGKGSTSHLIAAVLQAAGLKVGLYTSPHLIDLRERIRINGEPIPEDKVAEFIEQNRTFLDETQPSFFETMTAMAFAYFVEQHVDIAVVEVGLGGRLDSTNVLTPLVSVITNIGFDHTEFLGNTLPKIAREKAGIIKPGVPCVIGESHPQTINVFLERARECGILGEGLETTDCRIWFADQCGYMRTRRLREAPVCELKGEYQEKNMQTAYVALQVLRNYTNYQLPITNKALSSGFARVCSLTGLRGRWETLSEHPLIICDTGHNSHGLQYVAHQLKELPARRIWIIFGMVNDKDTDVVLRLMPKGDKYSYIFTTPNTHRARTAEEMRNLFLNLNTREEMDSIAIDKPTDALAYALENADKTDAIFIGGSNYLVGEILKYWNSSNPEIQKSSNPVIQ
ncbi:MAG: bifunctional folylpolyglutamate synthase/dihydrofolate synthase [Paludibacteraceae bacterium]|nr:bifunctional folylpolyglutamate synthase/dihydrofolate synthase [Paludibacteraceae bacterium]